MPGIALTPWIAASSKSRLALSFVGFAHRSYSLSYLPDTSTYMGTLSAYLLSQSFAGSATARWRAIREAGADAAFAEPLIPTGTGSTESNNERPPAQCQGLHS